MESTNNTIVKIENLKNLIIELRGQSVLIDRDVAAIYGVETKHINQAVKNNPEKFPAGYVVELTKLEKSELVKKIDQLNNLKHSYVNIKAFTEKGLYMLATILKSPQAVQATLAIIETFAKIRQLSRSIQELSLVKDKADQKAIMHRSGELITDLFKNELQTSDTETTVELNFSFLKLKHTIKKKKK